MFKKSGYLVCLSARHIHASSTLRLAVASPASGTKANLAKLRKKTGFSFVNCRKALEKFENDVEKAETWLREQAQKEGWSKATKLQGRVTAHGLIGVQCQGNSAVMVEVNCETDFVARNTKFQHLVGQVAAAALASQKGQQVQENVFKAPLSAEDLKSLDGEDGKTLQDLTALTIGQVGENMSIRRGLGIAAPEQLFIGSYVHSALQKPQLADPSRCSMGKYGALVVFKNLSEENSASWRPDVLGRRLSQHVVGMNPLKIGVYKPPEPRDVKATEEAALDQEARPDEEEGDSTPPPAEPEPETEEMLNQEYLLDPSVTVGELLLQENVEIVDFARFECGESTQES